MTHRTFWTAVAVLGLTAGSVSADTIVGWNFQGATGNQTSTASSIAASHLTGLDVTRGSGLTPSAASNAISASGWDGTPAANPADDTQYFQFGFEVAAGYEATLNQLFIGTRSSNTGPGNLGLFTSVDGFATQVATFTQSGTSYLNSVIDLSGLGPITGTILFRIIKLDTVSANGGTVASTGTFRLTNYFDGGDTGSMRITGSVRPSSGVIPEPSSIVLMGLGVVGLAGVIRLRRRSV